MDFWAIYHFTLSGCAALSGGQHLKNTVLKKYEIKPSLPSLKGIFCFKVIVKHLSHLVQSCIIFTNNIAYHGDHISPLR